MPRLSSILFVAFVMVFALPSAFCAEQAANKQKLFNIILDLKPNAAFQISQITGDVPISVVTDKNKNIIAVEISSDENFLEAQTASGKFKIPTGSAFIGHDWATKNKFKVDASSTSFGTNRDLFYVDATKLDAQKGGQIILRYPSSLIMGTLNEVSLNLRREGDRWVATIMESSFLGFQQNEKIVAKAKIETSFSGIGLNEPVFEFLDPNQVVQALNVAPISNPAMIESQSVAAKKYSESMKRSPIVLVPQIGLTAQVKYEPVDQREPASAASAR